MVAVHGEAGGEFVLGSWFLVLCSLFLVLGAGLGGTGILPVPPGVPPGARATVKSQFLVPCSWFLVPPKANP